MSEDVDPLGIPNVTIKLPRRRRPCTKSFGFKYMDSGDSYQTILTDGDSTLTPIDATMALAILHGLSVGTEGTGTKTTTDVKMDTNPNAAADSRSNVMLKAEHEPK